MTWTYAFDQPPALAADELRALFGGKGANLMAMTVELGLPVPPGFVITTEACKAAMAGDWPVGLEAELREQVARLEAHVGHGFGSAADPLLVSVRSGAPVSMPGMLDTILNLGLNAETTAGLAAVSGDPEFAAACRERLTAMYRRIVGVADVPDDPWAQLHAAVEAVFRSWDSERARSYRARESIPADVGTAVVVQAMVFGNRGPDSATGVLFTRDPATGENRLYGDVLFGAQGEDVVAGTHAPEPITALDARLPAVWALLRDYAARLERHYGDICDIEFTIEDGRLWMLQNRIGKRTAQAACRAAVEMAQDESFPLSRPEAVERVAGVLVDPPTVAAPVDGVPVVATGLAASPGLVSGAIATTPERAVELADAGVAVLLVRAETSPDDVHGMARSVGVLTSTGGLASHAAVVARGWDIPAVVGAGAVVVSEGSVTIDGRVYAEGEVIGIDGSSGCVYGGPVAAARTLAPEAATLLAWAQELGIDLGPPDVGGEDDAAAGSAMVEHPGPVTGHDLVRALAIKGYATAEMLGSALGASVDEAAAAAAVLVAEGLAKDSGGMLSLTDEGKARGTELLASDAAAWGAVEATAALDAFIVLDERMKEIVTAWQMREAEGEQVLNDHSDADYDAEVLDRLAELHVEVRAWLEPHVSGLPRLAAYGRRLGAAASAAVDGDGRFVASPRVDSYHGAWFELHEDLIRLAGRTREEEVAAGRA